MAQEETGGGEASAVIFREEGVRTAKEPSRVSVRDRQVRITRRKILDDIILEWAKRVLMKSLKGVLKLILLHPMDEGFIHQ